MIPTEAEMKEAQKFYHGKKLQEKFDKAVVAICGLGGLGSNIAISLARAGIGRMILIDFDEVSVSNLNRQQYKAIQVGWKKTEALAENLKEIAPYIEIETHNIYMDETNMKDLLKDADVICEAFDCAETKALLTNIVLENLPGKFLVAASGMAGIGSVNEIKSRRVGKYFYICGDGVSDIQKETLLFSSRTAVCAAHQAHMVLRILGEEFEA